MAFKGKCHYETAFDSRPKEEKKTEDCSFLIDRIANHPILQLLHLRRKSKTGRSTSSNQKQQTSRSTFYTALPSTSNDPKQQVGLYTPKGSRQGGFPSRSVSTNQLITRQFRPIGLSKSDDEILNRLSDSPEEEDCLEDYREGSDARDLANDIHSLHLRTQTTFAKVTGPPSTESNFNKLAQYPSAHYMSSDKYCIPVTCATRPFTSLSKIGSKVQPKKEIQETRTNLRQGCLSKSQFLPSKRCFQPLKLQSPPGTAPLPIKFSKKTPNTDKSPSSWFSPVRQKDMKLPVKKSISSDLRTAMPISRASSLNDSMVVLLDSSSQQDFKCILPPTVNVKYSSTDSIVTGSALSSMESLRSSMSDGNKSTISNESAFGSYKGGSSNGSDSSLVRPFLNLNAPHRSLIQSAKFQILSPISDKSHDPSSDAGGFSQKTSPQDFLELECLASNRQKTALQTPRNIQDDFRNVHHILPGPPAEGQAGSDSGISIEYKLNPSIKRSHHLELPFSDLPFDMPKLRRRLAAKVKPSLSSSNSSISSSANSNESVAARLSLPSTTSFMSAQPQNPTISKLQLSCGASRTGTSSSNSSDWDTRSSAESSEGQGTPKLDGADNRRRSLALELGCSAMSVKGQEIDTNLPLARQTWYHGGITRCEAENILRCHGEGSYIVRSISNARNEYSLALKSARGFMHFRVRFDHTTGQYTIGRSDKRFSSVPHIINHFSIYRIPIKGAEHMVLLNPIHSETL